MNARSFLVFSNVIAYRTVGSCGSCAVGDVLFDNHGVLRLKGVVYE